MLHQAHNIHARKIDFNVISAVPYISYDPFQQDFNRCSSVKKISVFIATICKSVKKI